MVPDQVWTRHTQRAWEHSGGLHISASCTKVHHWPDNLRALSLFRSRHIKNKHTSLIQHTLLTTSPWYSCTLSSVNFIAFSSTISIQRVEMPTPSRRVFLGLIFCTSERPLWMNTAHASCLHGGKRRPPCHVGLESLPPTRHITRGVM
jgi:hypothetical protein